MREKLEKLRLVRDVTGSSIAVAVPAEERLPPEELQRFGWNDLDEVQVMKEGDFTVKHES